MASITLKNLPSSLHRALKARASGNRRSLSREVVALLEAGITTPKKIDIKKILEEERRLTSRLRFVATEEDINRFKREGRP